MAVRTRSVAPSADDSGASVASSPDNSGASMTSSPDSSSGSVGVEPFEIGHGAGFEVQEDAPEAVECEVVEDGGDFRAHKPPPSERPRRLCFVDGVMRIEARLTRTAADGETYLGLAGSWGAGAALATADRPVEIAHESTGRAVVFTGGEAVSLPRHAHGWRWDALAVEDDDLDAARRHLRDAMRAQEARIAERLVDADWLTVFDGPLHPVRRGLAGGGRAEARLVGYVKTHHRRMLAAEHWRRVPELAPGERSSLFQTKVGLYACYLRVGATGPWAGAWAGIARLEVPGDTGRDAALAAVDEAAGWLPRFAPALHRDARAPVNLLPVAGLERHLRRLLGNPSLALRAVREVVRERNRPAPASRPAQPAAARPATSVPPTASAHPAASAPASSIPPSSAPP